jgi:ABC-2 type transport system ATP-binding protein
VNPTNLVEIEGLTKQYRGMDRPALDNLSMGLPAGRFFGLLGPNGAGKSTLIGLLCGLLTPTRGSVHIQGVKMDTDPERVKSVIGLVPQDLAIYPTLTARENLEFFGRMQGLSGTRLRERIAACLAIAHLEDHADRRAVTFSGGLKRRLNLVIGLVHEPKLLILDEPTVGIDPQSRNFIHESLRNLHRQGMTIIYTTHYMEEAEQLCDDVAIIDHGRILTRGTVTELLLRHHNGSIEAQLQQDLGDDAANQLRTLPHVVQCHIEGRGFLLQSDNPAVTLNAVMEFLRRANLAPISLHMGSMNLEQVFLALTGTRLRD